MIIDHTSRNMLAKGILGRGYRSRSQCRTVFVSTCGIAVLKQLENSTLFKFVHPVMAIFSVLKMTWVTSNFTYFINWVFLPFLVFKPKRWLYWLRCSQWSQLASCSYWSPLHITFAAVGMTVIWYPRLSVESAHLTPTLSWA